MDCQRLISLLIIGNLACVEDRDGRHAFDGPGASAWLEAGDGPFDEAIGFVANTRSGTIVPIDLKRATLLGDQLASPFLQPRWVATGDERLLGELVAWAPDSSSITLLVADHVHKVLVEAPYVTGVDEETGEPVVVTPDFSEPVFLDEDQSGDSAELVNLDLAHGYTTTEDWRVEYDGSEWWVFGSRSGKQSRTAATGEEWSTDNRELSFTIEGTATEGDRFELSTDTKIVEHDLGGMVLDLERIPDTDLLVAAVWSEVAQVGDIVVWNMRDGVEIGRVGQDDPADPYQTWKIALGSQTDSHVQVFAGSARRPIVQIIDLDLVSPENTAAATVIESSGPISALAWLRHEGHELLGEVSYEHLFVATTQSSRVDIFDLQSQTWVDVNSQDSGVGGIELHSPIIGLSASRVPVDLQQQSAWGAREDDRVVAVSTFDGTLMMIEGATGCLAVEEEGPSIPTSSSGEAVDFSDHGAESTPYLYQDPATGSSMTLPSCGGVTRSEIWSATFDGLTGNYIVEGTISGIQEGRAWEDQRYVSDKGQISFLLLAGAAPTTDGDTFSMQVDDGVLRIKQVLRPGGLSSDALELPDAPLVFDMEGGPTGGGWDEDRTQVHILLPVTNSDFVMRVRADAWETQVIWD
jgi:hypothetical protein